jgi:hypothetical protein
MAYDEGTCYWCGKKLPLTKDKKRYEAIFSLKTDTLQTRRNFCNERCLNAFKKKAKYRDDSTLGWYFLPAYQGKS